MTTLTTSSRLIDIPWPQVEAGLGTLVFGKEKPYSAGIVTAKVVSSRQPMGDTVVALVIAVREHHSRLPHGRVYSRPSTEFVYRFQVRDILRLEGRGMALVQHLSNRTKEGVRALHFLVREHDPRLGNTSFTSFPLFDPPGNVSIPHGGVCALCDYQWCARSPAKPNNECGRDTLMWAGANLTWVHPWCWDELHP